MKKIGKRTIFLASSGSTWAGGGGGGAGYAGVVCDLGASLVGVGAGDMGRWFGGVLWKREYLDAFEMAVERRG